MNNEWLQGFSSSSTMICQGLLSKSLAFFSGHKFISPSLWLLLLGCLKPLLWLRLLPLLLMNSKCCLSSCHSALRFLLRSSGEHEITFRAELNLTSDTASACLETCLPSCRELFKSHSLMTSRKLLRFLNF